jgi:hypothetical protein
MSAISNPSRYVTRSPEHVGARMINSRQWKPAQGNGIISRSSVHRPQNDRWDEGPYLTGEQVGIAIDSFYSVVG